MITRQTSWNGQQRVDVPHLRAAESSVCYDFDVLAGNVLGGTKSLIIKGFVIAMAAAVGAPASQLQLVTAGGILLNVNSSESGSVYQVPSTRSPEVLAPANSKVTGGFTALVTNFIGLDLRRSADSTTADLVQFVDANTGLETPKTVPLARTLDYKIVISTIDFSSTPHITPIAAVVTDVNNNVVSVADARNLMHRLGAGGSNPKIYNSYPWSGSRRENTTGDVFVGGDKAIVSTKDWMDAVMTSIWEVKGGEFWYSPSSDRYNRLTRGPLTFSNGEQFEWTGTNLHWKNLRFVFGNGNGAYFNDIADQTADSPGLTDLAEGDCIYVDLTYTSNATGGSALVAVKVALVNIGAPANSGSRYVLAWRSQNVIYTRDGQFAVGTTFTVATNTNTGTVQLKQAAGNPALPIVLAQDANGAYSNTATTGDAFFLTGGTNGRGLTAQGTGTGTGVVGTGGAGAGNVAGGSFFGGAGAGNSDGCQGTGHLGGAGGSFQAGATGIGVVGFGGGTSGTGVRGVGSAGNSIGVDGQSTGNQPGVQGTGGGTNSIGVKGLGNGTQPGVQGNGGATGKGGVFIGGGTSGAGVVGTASGGNSNGVEGNGVGSGTGVQGAADATGVGVFGQGGSISGAGVSGIGSASAATGVLGTGGATGVGVWGEGGATSGPGVQGTANGGNSIGVLGTGFGSGSGVTGIGQTGGSGNGVSGIGGTTGGHGVSGVSSINTKASFFADSGGGGPAMRTNGLASAPPSPSDGDTYYDTTLKVWRTYLADVSEWSFTIHTVVNGGGPAVDHFTGSNINVVAEPVKYYMDNNRVVHMVGAYQSGGGGAVLTLATGYRPAITRTFMISDRNTLAVEVTINTSGVLTAANAAGLLSGLTFPAAVIV